MNSPLYETVGVSNSSRHNLESREFQTFVPQSDETCKVKESGGGGGGGGVNRSI